MMRKRSVKKETWGLSREVEGSLADPFVKAKQAFSLRGKREHFLASTKMKIGGKEKKVTILSAKKKALVIVKGPEGKLEGIVKIEGGNVYLDGKVPKTIIRKSFEIAGRESQIQEYDLKREIISDVSSIYRSAGFKKITLADLENILGVKIKGMRQR